MDRRPLLADAVPMSTNKKTMSGQRYDFELPARILFRVGLGLLLLSLVFLFRYAVVQGWIGPAARIALAAVAGAAMVALGLWVSRRRRLFGVWLEGTGVAAWYITAFAAHRLYAMTGPTMALVQLAAVSAVAVGLALHERSSTMAAVGMVGALVAPLLLPGRIEVAGGDYSYVAVVLAAAAVLFLDRGWLVPLTATTTGAALVVLGDTVLRFFDTPSASTAPQLQFGVVTVWAAGWLVPVAAALVGRFEDRLRAVITPAVASVVVPLPAFGVSMLVWADADLRRMWALVAVGLAATHTAVAFRHTARAPRTVDTVVAVLFFGAATVLAFSGSLMVFLLAAVGVTAAFAARRLRLAGLEVAAHIVSTVAALAWLVQLGFDDPAAPAALVLNAAVPLLWAAAAVDGAPSVWPKLTSALRWTYGGAAHVGAMMWAAASFGALGMEMEPAVTAVWGALGIGEMVAARRVRSRGLMFVGFGTVLGAVAKLLLEDMATVEPVWRILSFAGFGLVLAAVGFWLGTDSTAGPDDPPPPPTRRRGDAAG